MRAVAADVVLILGDIGEMREIAEGAHDRERLVGVEAVERRLEFAPRADLVVAMEADRGLADALDEVENLRAFLLAHGVAEHAAEQADVLAQRRVLLGLGGGSKTKAFDMGGLPWRHPCKRTSNPRARIERKPRTVGTDAWSLRFSQ